MITDELPNSVIRPLNGVVEWFALRRDAEHRLALKSGVE